MFSYLLEIIISLMLIILGLFIVLFSLPYKPKENDLTPSEKYQMREIKKKQLNPKFYMLIGTLVIVLAMIV